MRLTLTIFLMLGLFVSIAHAEPSWRERRQTARYQTLDYPDSAFSVRELRLTLKAVSRIKGFSYSRATCIAERESGFNEHAYNSSSGASGIFQHLRSYWPSRAAAYTSITGPLATHRSPSPFNGRANIIVSGTMMSRGQWYHWQSTDSPC